jgi:glycerophosphoryl diester phosphodiesterase
MPKLFSVVIAGLVLCGHLVGQAAERPSSPAAQLVAESRVLVIAHRGDSLIAPENTLPAFESAVRAGADLVELDYLHSSDGVPFVIHDYTLDRTTNAVELFGGAKIKASSKSLADLLKLDAGSWFSPKFKGTPLPTLEQSLDEIQKGSVTLIERKGGDAKTCIELLRKKGLIDKVVVQAFDWHYLEDCHHLAPELQLGALGNGELEAKQFAAIKRTGAAAIGWSYKDLDAQKIAAIHDAGYKAWGWTIDNPADAQRLVDAGLDGIITNDPAKMRQFAPVANAQ